MKFTIPFSVSILLSLLIGMLNPPEETLSVNGATQLSKPHAVNGTKGTFPVSPRRQSPFITEPGASFALTQGTAALLAPAVTAIKTAVLVGTDNGTAGPTPGDVIEYTVTIANTGPDDATAVNFTDTVDPNTTLVPGSVKSAPIAVKDAYSTVGNVSISVPSTSGLTSNDVNLDAGDVISVTAVNQTGTEGQVTFAADGSFTFNPNPGFTGATTFTYTISDGTFTSTNTVTITMTGLIWFINAGAAAGGDGRLNTPFNSINAFNATSLDEPGDNIFVYSGTYNNTGNTLLLGQQKLIGQGAAGASLAALTGVTFSVHPPISPATIPAVGGTRPTINQATNNTNMQSQNQVRGVNINNTGGTALLGSGFTSALVREVSITNTGGVGVNFNSGILDVIIQSVNASNATNAISVTNTTGSFQVTGTGTTDGSGGTLTGISGRGIDLRSATNITLKNMTLTSANTTSDGGFAGACDEVNVLACFAAIYMDGVNTVSLDNIDIGGTEEHGIMGNSVSNLTMNNCTSINNGNLNEENALKFRNLTGTCSITNSSFQNSAFRICHIINTAGNVNLTVNNCTFNNSAASPVGQDCFEMRTQGSATATVALTNSTFSRARSKGIQVFAEDNSTMNLNITGCSVQRFGGAMAGIEVGSNGAGSTMNYNINDNPVIESSGEVAALASTLNSTLNGRLNRNLSIDNNYPLAGGSIFAIVRVLHEGSNAAKVEMKENPSVTGTNLDLPVDFVSINGTNAGHRLDAILDNNVVVNNASGGVGIEGIYLRVGVNPAGGKINTLCGDITRNQVTVPAAAMGRAFRANELDASSILTLSGTGPVTTMWAGNLNSNTNGTINASAGVAFTGVAPPGCNAPSHPTARIAAEPLSIIEKDRTEDEVAQVQEEVKIISDTPSKGPVEETNEVEEAARRAVVLSGETVTVGGVGGFLLPAGQNIIIKFQVSINTPLPAGICQISNQGTVSGGNFSTIQTDDAAGSPVNPTVNQLSKHSLGNLVYRDNNKSNIFDGGDVGINGVVVNLYRDNGSVPGILDGSDAFVISTTTAGGGLYTFSNLCSGDYIVQIPSSEFGSGKPLNGLISSPGGLASAPDNNTDNDDNGQDAINSSIASQAITLAYNGADVENNTTLDFGFRIPTLVTINDVTMNEGSGGGTTNFTFTVTRDDISEDFNLTVNTANLTTNGDFTLITGGMISFTAGGSNTASVTVVVNADDVVEFNETFNVLISGAPSGVVITDGSGLGTITNDDVATLNINSVTNIEGNAGTKTYTFTVTADKAVAIPYTVNVGTVDGTATTADNDYVANSTTLNFAGTANESYTFDVTVNGDLKVEPHETFTVALSSVMAGGLQVTAGPNRTGTINNDDAATISINDVSMNEGNSGTTNFTFTATLSAVVSTAVTVNFTTANGTAGAGDYNTTSGMITFPANGAGQMQTITVQVIGDAVGEANETFFVNLSNIVGSPGVTFADDQGLGTILDDDLSFSINDVTLAEGNAGTTNFTFTVTRTATATAETIDFTTAGNTATVGDNDFVQISGTLNFAIGDNSETFTVVINGDQKVELNESFFVNLNNASNGSIADGQGTGTITNDDQAVLSINSVSNAEGNAGTQTYTFTVTSDKAVDVPFTVNAGTANGTATTGDNDYVTTNATLNFAGTAGETQTFNVTVNGDLKVEPNETFTVPLSSVVASGRNVVISSPSGTGTGTITNDDAATISITDVSLNEGNSGTTNFVFNVTLSQPVSTAVTVDFATANGTATAGSDYIANSGTLTFPANGSGQTQTVTVTVNGDAAGEANETFFVNLTNIQDSPSVTAPDAQGLGTILDDDLSFSINDVTLAEGNAGTANFTFTVTRTSTSTVESIQYATANNTATTADNDYVLNSGTLNFAIGDNSETITVVINGDQKVELNESFFVNLSNASNGSIADAQGVGTITNDDAATVTLTGGSAQNEGNSGTTSYTFTATLNNAVQGGFSVAYTTSDGTATLADNDYTDKDGNLTFTGTAGEEKTITVLVTGDTKVEANETFTVALGAISSAPAGVTVAGTSQTGTITNDDAATVTLTGGSAQNEGNSGTTSYTFTATLNNAVQGGFSVAYTTSDGTATLADNDYTDKDGNLTFTGTAGEEKTITVLVTGDTKVEANETFTVALGAISSAPAGVTVAGTSQTGTITNDDAATLTLSGGIAQNEGNSGTTSYTFTATLNNAVQGGFSVAYTTSDGTATLADNDYTDKDGNLTFTGTAGEEKTITVLVNGDRKVEANETFTVALGTITGTTLDASITKAGSPQTGTVNNDEIDFGDAPTAAQSGFVSSYPTLTADGGGSHATVAGIYLGSTVDGEDDGQPTATANGDGSDDDGVTLPANLITGTTANITVNASVAGYINAWVDFNRDGDWNDAGEKIFNAQSVTTGNNNLMISVPAGATVGASFARFRFTTSSESISFTGMAVDGEVEDYQVNILNTQFTVNSPTVAEGNASTTNLTFTIARSNNANASSVDYAITGGTATSGSDYAALASGTASFTAGGALTQTVTVVVNGDLTVEDNETVIMTLTNPVGGGISTATGTGTITNDDAAALTLSGGIAKDETLSGTVSYTFTATLNAAVQGGFTIPYTTDDGTATVADDDYTDNDGTLIFTGTSGEQKTITVLVNGDNKVELNEAFTVALGAIAGPTPVQLAATTVAGSPQTGTITNDDAATVAIVGNVSQSESTTPQTFSVTLSNPVDVDVTVKFSTSDGTATVADNDYTAITNQLVTFPAGTATAQSVNVTVANDTKVEANEEFNVGLSDLLALSRNVSLGTASGTGTITNNDAATLTLTGGTAKAEGNSGTTSYTFTATLSAAIQGGFSIAYTTNDGTATVADADYTDNDGNLTFTGTAGEEKTITVLVTGDQKVEANEAFTVALGAFSATTLDASISKVGSPQTGTVNNDEIDFGDAPDPTYPTLLANNGARHTAVLGFYLGSTIDGDNDGQPTATANGDDTDVEGDDDDGVIFPAQLLTGTNASITVTASAVGKLDAWIDFNRDGDFADAGEQIATSLALTAGANQVTFAVPLGSPDGNAPSRFRFSSAGGLAVTGLAADGEVEDHLIPIINTLRIFVNAANVNPTQNGTTWATAFSSLQAGLSEAANSSLPDIEVWVAQGTYKPGTLRRDAFEIPSHIRVYGGFVGSETQLNERNWNTHKTILSGEIGTALPNDNVNHVVIFNQTDAGTRLDGFTIERGFADFVSSTQSSEQTDPTTLVSSGGGIAVINKSRGLITNCIITNNKAIAGGGLIQQDSSRVSVTKTIIWSNEATFGGGVYVLGGSTPLFENVLIVLNKGLGGGVYVNRSQPVISNSTLASNQGTNGTAGGIFNTNAVTTVKNSILWGNSSPQSTPGSVITYSIVAGGFAGVGNSSLNPLFVNPTPSGLALIGQIGDYHLQACSPAINAGDNTDAPAEDLDGAVRPFGVGPAIVDMGAYESQSAGGSGPATLSVTEPIASGTVLKTAGKITATNQVSGGTVVYNASQSVTLLPGFSASGATFQAVIGNCPN